MVQHNRTSTNTCCNGMPQNMFFTCADTAMITQHCEKTEGQIILATSTLELPEANVNIKHPKCGTPMEDDQLLSFLMLLGSCLYESRHYKNQRVCKTKGLNSTLRSHESCSP